MYKIEVKREVFFFNDTATTEIYTLSLHDALPIWMKLAGAVLFFVPWAALRWKARDMETRS